MNIPVTGKIYCDSWKLFKHKIFKEAEKNGIVVAVANDDDSTLRQVLHTFYDQLFLIVERQVV